MNAAIESFDFKSLSVSDRMKLIGRIWDSIEEDELELTPQQCAELKRRVAEEDAAGDKGITWPEMKRRLQEKS